MLAPVAPEMSIAAGGFVPEAAAAAAVVENPVEEIEEPEELEEQETIVEEEVPQTALEPIYEVGSSDVIRENAALIVLLVVIVACIVVLSGLYSFKKRRRM